MPHKGHARNAPQLLNRFFQHSGRVVARMQYVSTTCTVKRLKVNITVHRMSVNVKLMWDLCGRTPSCRESRLSCRPPGPYVFLFYKQRKTTQKRSISRNYIENKCKVEKNITIKIYFTLRTLMQTNYSNSSATEFYKDQKHDINEINWAC